MFTLRRKKKKKPKSHEEESEYAAPKEKLSSAKKKERGEKVIVLIDYEGISKGVALKGKILDCKGLNTILRECAKFGEVLHRFCFLPDHYIRRNEDGKILREIMAAGFRPMVGFSTNEAVKEKDRIDSLMTNVGKELIENTEIGKIVIVALDSDFVELATSAISKGVEPVRPPLEQVSFFLKEIIHTQLPSLNLND
jgi:uncharacterized LabA/DUF88 family protein